MKYSKIAIIFGASMLLLLMLATAASAQQRIRMREPLRDRIDRMIDVREFVRGLQLSDSQREDIKAIVKSHQTEILDVHEALLRARIELANANPNGPRDFGAAQTRIAELRQLILNQIKSKLTEEQLAEVQRREQNRIDLLEKALSRLQKRRKDL